MKFATLMVIGALLAAPTASLAEQTAVVPPVPAMTSDEVEGQLAAFAAQMTANPPRYPNLIFVSAEAKGLTLLTHLRFIEANPSVTDQEFAAQMLSAQCLAPAVRGLFDQYGIAMEFKIDAADGTRANSFRIDQNACLKLTGPAVVSKGTTARSPVGPPLTREELVTGARQLQAWKPRDQFSAPPGGPQFAGRAFSYALPISPRVSQLSLAVCSSLPHWGYNAALQELEVNFPEGLASPLGASADNDAVLSKIEQGGGNYVHFLPLVCVAREGASYRAHNALGAETTVFSSRETSIGVGYADVLSNDRLGFFSLKVAMSPDVARVVTKNLRIIVTGEIGNWLPGISLVCGRDIGRPTFNSPFDNSQSACVYRATVTKIEVVDGMTGQVLATHRP